MFSNLKKLVALSLMLGSNAFILSMEGAFKEPGEQITLISNDGKSFKVTPTIIRFSDIIRDTLAAPKTMLAEVEAREFKTTLFDSKTVGILASLVNVVQDVISQQKDSLGISPKEKILINDHIIAKNLQPIVNEQLANLSLDQLANLLKFTDFLAMPAFTNTIASVFMKKLQQEYKIADISDLAKWSEKWRLGDIDELLEKHWYLQQAGITDEWSIKDLISTGEKPEIDSNGKLDLLEKGLTSLDGLHDLEIDKIIILSLLDNRLVVLPPDIFQGLTTLKELYLIDNKLSSLPEKLFQGLNSLEKLYLFNNQLRTLPEKLFQGLTALKELDLSNNQLTTLPENLFQGLTALKVLDFSNNQLRTLPGNLFQGLTSLKKLDLFENKLSSLPEKLFQGLTTLKELVLSNNQLTTLPLNLLPDLTALESLRLNKNQLSQEDIKEIKDKLKEIAPYASFIGSDSQAKEL